MGSIRGMKAPTEEEKEKSLSTSPFSFTDRIST